MPVDNTIALQVKTPTIADSPLSSLLDMQGKQQQIQAARIANQSNNAILGERNNVRALFQNPQEILDENGNIDFNKAGPKIMSAAPTQGSDILTKLINAQKDSVAAKQATSNLSDSQRNSVGQFTMSLGNDKPEVAYEKLDNLRKLNPQLGPAIDFAKTHYLQPNEDNPEAFKKAALQLGQSVMLPDSQKSAMTPSGYLADNGQQTGLMNTNPMAGDTGIVPNTLVQKQLPINELETTSTNPVTQSPVVTTKDAMGHVVGITQAPTGAGVPQLGVGDPQAIPQLSQEREAARTQLAAAGNMHENNRIILTSIDKAGPTGVTGPIFQKIASTLGIQFSGQEDKASAYDLVGKALERNALAASSMMGPQTNANLDAQIKANGSVGYNPTAIKTITKLNDAIVSGGEAYQPGLEKAISANGNNVLAKRQFDQSWAQNFDPKIMMIYNAQKFGDKAEINTIINQLGGKNSPQVKELMQKATNLHNLSQNGHL